MLEKGLTMGAKRVFDNIKISHRIWLIVILSLLGLVLISTIAIQKAKTQFSELKKVEYANSVSAAIKVIDYFYQQSQQGLITNSEARAHAKAALKNMLLSKRQYFYISNEEGGFLLMHPFIPVVLFDDTPEQLQQSTQASLAYFERERKKAGESRPRLNAVQILKQQNNNKAKGFFRYYLQVNSEGTSWITGLNDPYTPPDIEQKLGYGDTFHPWGWVVLTGIYLGDEAKTFRGWMLSMATISLVLIVALIFVAVVISRSIVSPLTQAVELMDDISSGTGDLTKNLDDYGNNEVSQLSRGFNVFVGKIKDIVREVQDTNTVLKGISADSQHIMKQTASRSIEQLNETEMLATATGELSSSLSLVEEKAQSTSEAAHAAETYTSDSQKAMDSNIESINALTEILNSSKSDVSQLQQHSEKVSTVLNVIVGIAEQTNLLALNAAIEAARAGEQGRGFAVVADEVRTLAQKTQNSTKEISEIINNLQSGTNKVVEAITEGMQSSEQCVETAKHTNTAILQMADFVDKISQMSQDIASAVEQQSKVTKDIADSSVSLATSSKNNTEDNKENQECSDKLQTHLLALDKVVSQFNTGNL